MVKGKGSLGLTRSMAYHPEVQHGMAEITMELESIRALLESVAVDWSNGVDHGGNWPIKLVSAKHKAVVGAWQVVDKAMDLSGGFGMFKKHETRTPVPRRARRTLPPGQSRPLARTRRQADARDQSGRAAAVGIRTLPWFAARGS